MSKQFKGYGPTLEAAVTGAAESALKEWNSRGPDDMAVIKLEEIQILYGGIVGHVGTRVATVSLEGQAGPSTATRAASTSTPAVANLTLKVDVFPDLIYANLMPPVRRPQPHRITLLLSVSNCGSADFSGQSPDSGVVRFSILRGRTTIWRWPEITSSVVTPVTIRVGETRTYRAIWEMADAVDMVDADLNAVAIFVPTGQSAVHPIQVQPVF